MAQLSPEQEVRFEQFLMSDEIQKRIKRIVKARTFRWGQGRRRNQHVYLDPEDLRATAHAAAYEIFARYDGRVPDAELLPLTVSAVVRRLTNESIRAQRHGDADGIIYALLDRSNCVDEYERVQFSGGTFSSGASQKNDFVDPEAIASFEDGLQGELSRTIGEPDALTRLVVRESIDVAVDALSPAEQKMFRKLVKSGGVSRQGRPTSVESKMRKVR